MTPDERDTLRRSIRSLPGGAEAHEPDRGEPDAPPDDAPWPEDDDAPPGGNVVPINRARPRKRKAKPAPGIPQSEIDVAALLAAQLDGSAIYVAGSGWFLWDGCAWRLDRVEQIREIGKRLGGTLREQAAALDSDDLWRLAQRIESARGIDNVLRDCESDPRLRRLPDALDAHAHLLGVENGTIDLHDGTLRPSSPADLITKVCPTRYDPAASFADFDRLLVHLVPDVEARAYLRRLVGYSITGDTREDAIVLLVGAPRCGKSTLLVALRGALGPYFGAAQIRSFAIAHQPGANPARPDLWRLLGARLVAASEVRPGLELDHGLLKAISGGESLPVRTLYAEERDAKWIGKLWLVANDGDLPRARAEDDAFWERVRRVPVGSTLPQAERDEDLRQRLEVDPAARAAVLAWAVAGAVEWYREGLGAPPASVAAAGAELRETMDSAGPWIAERVRFVADGKTPKAAVREAYERACEDAGEHALGSKRFAASLRAAATRAGATLAESTMRHGGRVAHAWTGLVLRDDEESSDAV